MIFIAERLNGQFHDVRKAIEQQDGGVIQKLAKDQTDAGATYLDVNVGTAASDQEGAMKWLVEAIQETCDTPIALDSQKLPVIQAGIEALKPGSEFIVNSCPLNKRDDEAILDKYLGLVAEHNCSLVTLTMDKEGVPQDVDKRAEIAMMIVAQADALGVAMDKLFIDPIVLPVNVAQDQPTYLLEVMGQVKMMADPAPHMTVGLSNISPKTSENASLINRTFLAMAMAAGLDSAICDVFDTDLMDAAITADMLLNKQIYSDSFLKAARA